MRRWEPDSEAFTQGECDELLRTIASEATRSGGSWLPFPAETVCRTHGHLTLDHAVSIFFATVELERALGFDPGTRMRERVGQTLGYPVVPALTRDGVELPHWELLCADDEPLHVDDSEALEVSPNRSLNGRDYEVIASIDAVGTVQEPDRLNQLLPGGIALVSCDRPHSLVIHRRGFVLRMRVFVPHRGRRALAWV